MNIIKKVFSENGLFKNKEKSLEKQIEDLKRQIIYLQNENKELKKQVINDLEKKFKKMKKDVIFSFLTPVMIEAREWLLNQDKYVMNTATLRSNFKSFLIPNYFQRFKKMLILDDNFDYFSNAGGIKSIIVIHKNNPVVMTAVKLYKNTEKGKIIDLKSIIDMKGEDFAKKVSECLVYIFGKRVIRVNDSIFNIKKRY